MNSLRRSRLLRAGAVLLVLSAAALALSDVVLVSTGFEGSAYVPGTPLDGQDGWVTIAGRDAVLVSDSGANQGSQCVKMLGSALVKTETGKVEAFCGKYLLYDPVQEGTPIVRLRTSARLDGPDSAGGRGAPGSIPPDWGIPGPPWGDGGARGDDIVNANFYVATVLGENIGALSVSSDGAVYAVAGGHHEPFASVPYQPGTYVDLELRLDFGARTTTFLVDGQSIGTAPMYPQALQSTELIAAAIEMQSWQRIRQDVRALYTVRFDDYSVTASSE